LVKIAIGDYLAYLKNKPKRYKPYRLL